MCKRMLYILSISSDFCAGWLIVQGTNCDTVECRYKMVQYIMLLHTKNAVTGAKHKSGLEITKDTPYLALTGEI